MVANNSRPTTMHWLEQKCAEAHCILNFMSEPEPKKPHWISIHGNEEKKT